MALCNILDFTTLPVGNYREEEVPGLGRVVEDTPNFDFFNYAGLQRHVLICRVPRVRISEISVVAGYEADRGRAVDPVMNLKDIRLIKWMGGNSLRTSPYCYPEEYMRLCDREGIAVIDEVPAVGLMVGFGAALHSGAEGDMPPTWKAMKTADHHR